MCIKIDIHVYKLIRPLLMICVSDCIIVITGHCVCLLVCFQRVFYLQIGVIVLCTESWMNCPCIMIKRIWIGIYIHRWKQHFVSLYVMKINIYLYNSDYFVHVNKMCTSYLNVHLIDMNWMDINVLILVTDSAQW